MISRRRCRRMLQTLDCRGLSPPARAPPQWAGVHDVHPGQFTGPALRSRAGGGAAGPQLKAFSSQPYERKVWPEPRYIAASDTQGPGADLFGESARPGFPLRWRSAGGR
jgi:hypothetical protein